MLFTVQSLGIKKEPVLIGRAFAAFQNMMKLPEAARRMIEDSIEHNTNIFLVSFLQQFHKCNVATEQQVHVEIIIGVVTMIRSGGKNGVEIKSRDSQIL